MKQELKKYPKMTLVSTVYGNDDPTTATQVTQGLLQQYPNLKGIISPTTVGIAAAAAVLDTAKYRGKIALTGLGTPGRDEEVRLRRHGQGVRAVEPGQPRLPGRLRRGRAGLRQDHRRVRASRSPPASSAATPSARTTRSSSARPYVFSSANIAQFNF